MEAVIVPTSSQLVFQNSLIMSNIYSYVPKKDLINCMMICQDGLPCAAKGLYKEVPENLHKQLQLLEKECPFVSCFADL